MSGNLREWTGSPDGTSFEVRGGSFTDIAQGISCDNDFISLAPASTFDNVGFRCCRDTAPPVAP
jgi:formylglycine-generating enzyme required for sulfatase activity